ncbi:MAG: flippase [Okeania sp. SIO2H7]|nr:flippase [Okeania sp. SIO2H7]
MTSIAQTQNNVSLNALARESIIAIVLQIAGLVLAYLVEVLLAQWMGRTEYGIYAYVISWSLILAIPAGLGLPRAVLRFICEYKVKQEWGLLRGLLLSSWELTVAVGLLLCLGGTGIILWLNRDNSSIASSALLVGMLLVPLQGLVLLQEDMARGAGSVTLAYGPTKVLWPILVIFGGFVLFEQQPVLSSIPVIWVAIATLLAVILLQLCLLWLKFDREIVSTPPIYILPDWLKVALPLLLYEASCKLLLQMDVLMLGLRLGAEEVGAYSAATKTALWVNLILQAINIVAAPAFATLYAQNDRRELQEVVSTVALWIFVPSVAIALCLTIFSQPILSLFGAEFVVASWELKILALGQLIDVMCGSVGYLMIMTGHQNQSFMVSGCCLSINLVLNAIAIPLLGRLGAAIATAFTLIVWNVWMSILVVRHIQINPSIFSLF